MFENRYTITKKLYVDWAMNPVMLGGQTRRRGTLLTLIVLAVGCVVSLIVSLLVIKGLMEYVRKRSFAAFGVYRIVLGILVIGYFLVKTVI